MLRQTQVLSGGSAAGWRILTIRYLSEQPEPFRYKAAHGLKQALFSVASYQGNEWLGTAVQPAPDICLKEVICNQPR
jgi:hypothetical protein